MERMLVTQALNELKLLDARIRKNIENATLITAARTASDKVVKSDKYKTDFADEVNAAFNSINDLIDRRAKIKSAIILSNANTKVSFNETEYTVAELIDLKSSIAYKSLFLNKMEQDFYRATAVVEQQNQVMQSKLDKLVETSIGTADKKKTANSDDTADINSISSIYRKNNEYSLVDPLKINDEIIKLNDYIEKVKSSVDAILQISNCTTYIEI